MSITIKGPRSIGWRIPVNGEIYTPYKQGKPYKQTGLATFDNPRHEQEFNNTYCNLEIE